MAELAVDETLPTPPVEELAVTTGGGDEDAQPAAPGDGEQRRKPKRELEPIPVMTVEEAKAKLAEIGKVDKPNEDLRNERVAAIQDEIKKHKARIEAIKIEMDNITQARSGNKDELSAARNVMKELRTVRDTLQEELDRIVADRQAARERVDRHVKTQKSAQSELKYNTVAEMDAAIAALEKKQQTQSMSLSDEKKLIKEIEQLMQSKKALSQFAGVEETIKSAKETADNIRKSENDKWTELKAIKDKIAEQRKVVDELSKSREAEGNPIGDLIAERNEVREKMSELHDQINEVRQEHKDAEDAFWNNLREQRKYQAAIRKAEYEARRAAEDERRKAFEAEEAKKVPYEEEMTLCDALVSYLETTFLKDSAEMTAATAAATAKGTVEERSEFGGQRLVVRKRDEEDYMMMGGPKKTKGKKGGGVSAPAATNGVSGKKEKKVAIVHALDTLESFSLLQLTPPSNRAAVPAAIEALKEKKVWYSQQPRGSVPKPTVAGGRGGAGGGNKSAKAPELSDASAFPDLPALKPKTAAEEEAAVAGEADEGGADGEEGLQAEVEVREEA